MFEIFIFFINVGKMHIPLNNWSDTILHEVWNSSKSNISKILSNYLLVTQQKKHSNLSCNTEDTFVQADQKDLCSLTTFILCKIFF